jgi:pilus assembly protein FimV
MAQRDADRAIALLQQIVQRNPGHVKTLVKLAEVYRTTGQESLVASNYSQLTEAYIKQNQFEQAASILEMLVAMEPQNEQHRTKLQFVRERQSSAGRPSSTPAAAPAAGSFEMEEEEFDLDQPLAPPAAGVAVTPTFRPLEAPAPRAAAKPARPALEAAGPLSPEDKEFLDEHLAEGRVFRKYGLVEKALDQFEAILARFPDNVDARRELVELHKEKGAPDKAAENLLVLAEAFRLRGDQRSAEGCESEARGLMPVAQRAAAPARPAAQPPPPSRPAPAPAEEEIPIDVEEMGLPEPPAGPGLGLEDLDLGGEGEGLPDQFLDEEPPSVVTAPPARAALHDLRGAAPASRASARAPIPEAPFAIEEEPAAEMDIPLSLGEEAEAPDGVGAGQYGAGARGALRPDEPAELDLPYPSNELSMDEELDLSTPAAPLPLIEHAPSPRNAPLSLEEDLLGSLAEPEPVRPAPRPLAHAAPAPRGAGASPLDELGGLLGRTGPAVRAAPTMPADLQRVLDDVDQSLAFGFVDEAKEALRSVGTRYPGHPAVLDKIEKLGHDRDLAEEIPLPPAESELPSGEDAFEGLELPEPEPPPEVAPPSRAPTYDLGAELGGLFGAQSAVDEPLAGPVASGLGDLGLSQIFEEFKKGVDRQLGKEDYDTRYNLGIAYKEMGLLDEAIAEFQLAAKDEGRILECSSMLGLCFMEKGMSKLAIKWFEKGLKAPGRLPEEYQGLRYDLATAYEAAGEPREAQRLFSELYGQDATFRDVAAKVKALRTT